MEQITLKKLFSDHKGKVSDKWDSYILKYEKLFYAYRNKTINLLEIGVQNGGSLEIWAKYFHKAKNIVGCDINNKCGRLVYKDPRITIIVGDINSQAVFSKLKNITRKFDIIIDDGSHYSSDIIKTFVMYFPKLSERGLFIIEDLHCSYWNEYEGGLFNPYSAISFFKRLIDVINYKHWGLDIKCSEVLNRFFQHINIDIDDEMLKHIHSIEFYNSICIITKRAKGDNALGKRVVTGSIEQIVKGVLYYNSSNNKIPEQNKKDIRLNNEIILKEFNNCNNMLVGLQKQLIRLNKKIKKQNYLLKKYKNSIKINDDKYNKLIDGKVKQNILIKRLLEELNRKNKAINELENKINERNKHIDAIYSSTSWKITLPVRVLGGALKIMKYKLNWIKYKMIEQGGIKQSIKKIICIYKYGGSKELIEKFGATLGTKLAPGSEYFDRNDYVEWIRRYDTIDANKKKVIINRINEFKKKPLISIIMPTYNAKPEWLIQAIESVKDQLYQNWELCIADDASKDLRIRKILNNYMKDDKRIKVVFRSKNGHISAASNSAVKLANGEWLALLDHDDMLSETALFWVVDAINRNPVIELIYSDEDKIDEKGVRFGPYFKPEWNIDLFYSQNLFSHLGAYKTDLIRQIGGFRIGKEGSQDYDLVLRCIERIEPNQIYHIPRVLYHWRIHEKSTAKSISAKPYAMISGENALNDHFLRKRIKAKAIAINSGMYRVRYDLPENRPKVTIIIVSENNDQKVKRCIKSIVNKTTYSNYEILIICSTIKEKLKAAQKNNYLYRNNISFVRFKNIKKMSIIHNKAVNECNGEIICFLDKEIEVITEKWLSEMVSHAVRPKVGAVGAKILCSNGKLKNCGVILGINGVAGYSHKYMPANHNGYFGRANLIQSLSAVSGECLVIRKDIYERVGGFNEQLRKYFQDVDLCLRIKEEGYRNVWTPYAKLFNNQVTENINEISMNDIVYYKKDYAYMKKRWGDILQNDPAYSPNLTLEYNDFSLAWPPRI